MVEEVGMGAYGDGAAAMGGHRGGGDGANLRREREREEIGELGMANELN